MKIRAIAMLGAITLATIVVAQADEFPENNPNFEAHHPRQKLVLRRADAQMEKLNELFQQGKIPQAQRDQLLQQLNGVRDTDITEAKKNSKEGDLDHSFITPAQEQAMLREEDAVDKAIGVDTSKITAKLKSPENNAAFDGKHPREAEVLERSDREKQRINDLFQQGKITAAQRDQYLSQVETIRAQEMKDAMGNSKDGKLSDSSLTRSQDQSLNAQEAALDKQIGLPESGTLNAKAPEDKESFDVNHPRQGEVLEKSDAERRRINDLFHQGKISAAERDNLLQQVNDVRKEDVTDAEANSKDGKLPDSSITKGQRNVMNQQENAINKEIKNEVNEKNPKQLAAANHNKRNQRNKKPGQKKKNAMNPQNQMPDVTPNPSSAGAK